MKTPWWFLHKTPLAFLLLPFSWFYYFGSRFVFWVRHFFAYKSRRKIICIGGILAGGVGKTPVVRCIAKELESPVVMRGYKKSAKTGNVGDEAMMLANDSVAVHVGDRKSNIILLDKQSDKTPIVMDDGMQNPKIKKDISVLVFDQGIGFGNGFILPAGPLREPKRAARHADAIIVMESNKPKKNFNLPSHIPVFYAKNKTVSPYKNGTKLVAFAGIGYPKKFFNSLTGVVATKSFADHYQYTDKDIKDLFELADKKDAELITTEKDWVRLPDDVRKKIKFARLETEINPEFFVWLKERLNVND